MKTRLREDPSAVLRKIETLGWTALALLSLGAAAAFSPTHGGALALGGALGLANFRCMDLYFARLFRKGAARPNWWVHLIYIARFGATLAALAAALGWLRLPAVGLIVGLSVPILAIVLYAARTLAEGKPAARV